jgi:MFS transporter, FHS family, glucose/mannose:H+ symporter
MPNSLEPQTRTTSWLYLGFLVTGVATTLLSCLLPTLSARWHVKDATAGILFAAQFSGSALGALLVTKRIFASLIRGYLLLIASALTIAFSAHLPQPLFFLCFGLGLGLTMTSTSMWIGLHYAGSSGKALSLLNAFWSIGASLSPAIVTFWTHRWSPTLLFLVLALSTTIVLVFVTQIGRTGSVSDVVDVHGRGSCEDWQLLVVFSALGFFYVGVEASIGGWLMTYVHRLPVATAFWAPFATSVFWISLLCGRMIAPAVLTRITEARLLDFGLVMAWISTVAMLLSRSPLAITLIVTSAGLVLGPIFPLCLAKALTTVKDPARAKWVFAVSGLGAAVFPWITGLVSSREGSLRVGLLVPVLALTTMILLNRLERERSPILSE